MSHVPPEWLSAHLDGELDEEQEALVAELLARSDDARSQLAALEAVRSELRALPPVDPPGPLVAVEAATWPAPAQRRRARTAGSRRALRRLAVAGSALAAAACLAVFVLVPPAIVPAVDDLAVRHEMAMAGDDEAGGFDPMALDELRAGGDAPSLGDRWEPMAGYARDEVVHVVYSDGTHEVSVYRQPGRVAWGSLPDGGEEMVLDGAPAWSRVGAGGEVVVTERPGTVITVVAAAPHEQVMDLAGSLARA